MKWSATIANSLWIGSGLPALLRFQRALSRPAETQHELLQRLIEKNANSAYGRAHNFGRAKTYREFVRQVPLVDYETIAPWIDRVCRGEAQVLTSETVTHLIPTSGSTGERKLIPFTAGLQREFNRAIAPWIADLARQHAQILFGPAYWSITPKANQTKTESSAVPIGFADDASYLGGVKGRLVRATMVAPEMAGSDGDLADFRYRTLLCLMRQRDLRLISVWHPSFLSLLLDSLPVYWDKLLAQLECEKKHRFVQLREADPERPETVWRRLRVISCWGDGHAELSLADLRRRFPHAIVQPKGLLATEAFVTIPFAGFHPVAIRSHFYEFIDAGGQVRRVHELQESEHYEVVVTTSGGLWRYRTGDRVEVERLLSKTPSLRFVGRGTNSSDLFGEKLSEAFVAKSIKDSLGDLCLKLRFAFLAPDHDKTGWHYTLYVEGARSPELAKRLELALCKNPQYAHCRVLGQLESVRVFEIAEGGYEAFTARLLTEGKRLGDIKPTPLCNSKDWSQTFKGEYAPVDAKTGQEGSLSHHNQFKEADA